MNTKHFPAFSLFIFILLSTLVSCSSEDPFIVCKISEYDCDFQQRTAGILTVTKGSSRRHYILTEKGMKRAQIKEGEPLSYNPVTGTALVKEVTDSTIDVFTVDALSGHELSSGISLKPRITGRDGKPFFALPNLLSGCTMNDGTILLLVNYEKPGLSSGVPSESYDFLFVYEKGDAEKLKKYVFPYYEEKEDDTAEKEDRFFWDEPRNIQCTGEKIYIFSERSYAGGEFFHYNPQPNWILEETEIPKQQENPSINTLALIAHDNVFFNLYSERENTVYSLLHYSEKDKEALGALRLTGGYELPEEPVEKENGEFLLSVTPDGRTLVFFIRIRGSIEEEERLEPLFQDL